MFKIFIPSFPSQLEYDQFRELAEDGDKLLVDLDSYEKSVATLKRGVESTGSFIVRGPLILSDMVRWLKSKDYENSGKFRSLYYAELARHF